jgi:hypothetical protein
MLGLSYRSQPAGFLFLLPIQGLAQQRFGLVYLCCSSCSLPSDTMAIDLKRLLIFWKTRHWPESVRTNQIAS